MRSPTAKLYIVLALCLSVFCVPALFSCTRTPDAVVDVPSPVPATAPPTEAPTPPPTAAPTPAPTPEPARAKLMLVGDLMCLAGQQLAARRQGENGLYYFAPSFQYVKPVFDRADCVIGNLETVLSSSTPYSTEAKEIAGMPNCNGPSSYLSALEYAGFDALVMANNHCCDGGSVGITETVGAVQSHGFAHTGLFVDENAERFIILDVNGLKIGLLSYAEFYNSRETAVINEGNGYMINTYSEEAVRRDVSAARAAGAEFIIAYNHWGKEHVHEPTQKVLAHAQQMADAGVDLIAGSHPHAVQPVVNLTASDGRRVLCIYSLGNFVSSMGRSTANDTFIAEIDLVRTSDGVRIESDAYLPCRVFAELNGMAFVVVPTDTRLADPDKAAALSAAEERILAILGKE